MAGEETLVWNMGYAIVDLLYYVSDQRDHTEDRSKGIREVIFYQPGGLGGKTNYFK